MTAKLGKTADAQTAKDRPEITGHIPQGEDRNCAHHSFNGALTGSRRRLSDRPALDPMP
jgi:hypothetical protein